MAHTTSAAMTDASAEKDWIGNPRFWSLFVRMIANAAEAGGPAESAKLIRSMCDASGIPPERVIAKLKTHLFCHGPEPAVH
jgi:hypothetical protein